MEELSSLLDRLTEENKIGEGTYRDVYQVSPDICAKKLKPRHIKNYWGFSVSYPTHLYTLFKFGVADFNKYESAEYQRITSLIPKELRDSFAHIRGVEQGILFQDLVKDFSGKLSIPLSRINGPINNRVFWDRMKQLKEFFLNRNILYYNLKPDNILVMGQNSERLIPVISDYKRIGPRTYPFQPELRIPAMARQKLIRRFERLISQYKG